MIAFDLGPDQVLGDTGSGMEALSDADLVSLVIRTGVAGRSNIEIAEEVLDEHGGIAGLGHASVAEILRPGLKEAKAASILASVEIGRRLAKMAVSARDPLGTLKLLATYLWLRYSRPDQETMGGVFLGGKGAWIGEAELFRGTLSRCAVEPRRVIKEALLRQASGFILFHCHPSGDPTPSAEDLLFTRALAQGATVMGVRMKDHLILGTATQFLSLRERRAF